MDLFENAGTVCSAPKAYMQGMPEIVQKAHILEARANAPCADQGIGNDAVALQSVDVRAGKGIRKSPIRQSRSPGRAGAQSHCQDHRHRRSATKP